MFGILNPWKYGTIGLAIALALCAAWGTRVNSLRAGWETKYTALDGQAQSVLMATQQATNNPELKWPGVPAQITALASSNLTLKNSIDATNDKIDALNAETLRLKTAGDDLRAQLSTAQAARASYTAKLDAMALEPGDHKSCPALLSQTQDALDLAWSSGQ